MSEQHPIITRIDMLCHPLAECMGDDARLTSFIEWSQDAKKFIMLQQELLAEALYWCDENTPEEITAKIERCLSSGASHGSPKKNR